MLKFTACKKNSNQAVDNIPYVPINLNINLATPLYSHLNNPGTYVVVNGGYRGVIITHDFDGRFYALEKTCTFQSLDSCAHIQIDTAFYQLKCGVFKNKKFESCCNSKFSMTGQVIQSPSVLPLKQYYIEKSGTFLIVKN